MEQATDNWTRSSMNVSDILCPERTFINVEGTSKKRVLENAATLIARQSLELDPDLLFNNLINREKLGSTAIGKGIAIPHCRMDQTNEILGSLIRLKKSVDFDALDREPVDLLFVLLVPREANEEHLTLLGKIAKIFSEDKKTAALRTAQENDSLYKRFIAS